MPAPVLQFKRGNAGVAGTVPALRPGEPAISLNNFDFFIGIDTSVVNNKFFGSHRYWEREDGTNALKLKLVSNNGQESVNLRAPTGLGATITYTLPGIQGLPNSVLTNDGTGVLTWGSGSDNAVFTGITTINGTFLDVNVNSDFSGIATFSNTTDNTLGNANTGAVQIDGGLGVNKNVTVGGNLNVQGYSEFVGVVTFKGGTINLGDENTDNINVSGEFISNLTPNDDNTYDIGISTQRWRDGRFAGIGSFATGVYADAIRLGISAVNEIDTASGDLVLNSASGRVAISTTTVASGIRLAVGTGITMSDTGISATNFYGELTGNASSANQVKTVTASDNNATYHITFVDANNGSATNETVYTDDGIYYNPGTNTFTTQHALFTGDITVQGTIVGIASTARTVNTTGTSDNATYYATFVDTSGGQVGETLRTGTALSLNASTGNVKSAGDLIAGSGYLASGNGTRSMYMYDTSGDVSFQGKVISDNYRSQSNANNTLTFTDLDATFARNLYVTGIATVNSNLIVGGDVRINGSDIQASDGNTNITLTSNTLTAFAGDIRVNGNDIQASDGNANITMTSNTLTAFAGDVKVGGNDIQASDGNVNITMTSNTLTEVKGDLQVTGNDIKSSTGANAISLSGSDVTVNGNLYVNGSTTQVNTSSLTVEDRTIELGLVDGSAPGSATTWDLGVLFNYNSSGAKKSGVIWEHADGRFKFGSQVADGGGTDNSSPQITFTAYAPIEVGALWVNDCAGQSQVISCTGTERFLENITVDCGSF